MQLPPFKLERYFARYEFTAPYLLSSSDCESWTVQELLALEPAAHDLFQRHWLGYTESPGALALRQEICRVYTTIQPDQVLVHSGAEEAIFLFMHAALQAGDHAIVHSPCYQSLAEVARAIGCEVTPWQASESNGWALDNDELRRSIRPNTRVVVLNTPHNPTGFLMPREQFDEVNGIARENGLILFSDEVYRESEYAPANRLPAGCDVNEQAVSLGVMSKTYGLPGLRIGWIATHDAELYARMATLKDYTTICNSAPSEFLAGLALRHREKLARRNLDIITANLAILDDFFARHDDRFAWIRPQAGPIAYPRLLNEDAESFCHDLVTTAGVLLLPGAVYDDPGNHFRIGFGRRNLPEAIARLEEFLRQVQR
ncbi:MAG: aminotransferase class I/II-fold pyridoxal phosphate-dependent enzyme [Chloroflexi bacterium]|nr:aminotransferase class I/II-fold pyridoxal phosphate-dependent enzyme [Chloroflexota bacterium]MCI0577143.1 aminotransferase class I/II-fold pyridoxal phosphate-dependent enzyme [Chloroflexota bacterium]MCI0644683.1 aminotransferase class I/II-fold pyridoxal phosphate-dependent enzyme [Chloroflexota bacterium]MCI0730381.1 aminotransferase class I/II-fold pyridoxal phosphate-dependent enzyme [Chloroflexota bacterium]